MPTMKSVEKMVNFFLGGFGLHLTRSDHYRALIEDGSQLQKSQEHIARSAMLARGAVNHFSSDEALILSHSQLGQDFFALSASGYASEGFFVEFGACDGVIFSNTHLLEKLFKWRGILSEPNVSYHNDLNNNRSAMVDNRAVSGQSGDSVAFLAAGVNSSFFELRNRKRWGSLDSSYSVETVSLLDLLKENGCPPRADFLSIDTEGAELEILSNFDFSAFRFNAVAVELNGAEREIQELLEANDYQRVYSAFSRWDGWFVDSTNRRVVQRIPEIYRH